MKKVLLSLFLIPSISFAQNTIMLVEDIVPGTVSGNPKDLILHDGALYMYAGTDTARELYKYTFNGTCSMVQNIANGQGIDWEMFGHSKPMLSYNGKLYFWGNDIVHGAEMLQYDGNSITPVGDINPGAGGSEPMGFTELGGKIYFCAEEAFQSEELWSYNPVSGAIVNVHNEQSSNSYPSGFKVFNNKLYFNAFDVYVGHELRCYDPSNNSYTTLSDFTPGLADGLPSNFQVTNNKLYFTARSDSFGRELYSYTGTGVPVRLTDFNAGTEDGIGVLFLYNDEIYFNGDDGTGDNLYKYNPVSGNISMVHDHDAGSFCIYNNKLYFNAEIQSFGNELCVYDGNSVALVTDFTPGSASSSSMNYKTVYNGEMYFAMYTASTGMELYKLADSALNVEALSSAFSEGRLSPNPTSGMATISFQSGTKHKLSVVVYDALGKKVIDRNTSCYEGKNEIELDLSGFSSGIFYCYVITQDGANIFSGKVCKY